MLNCWGSVPGQSLVVWFSSGHSQQPPIHFLYQATHLGRRPPVRSTIIIIRTSPPFSDLVTGLENPLPSARGAGGWYRICRVIRTSFAHRLSPVILVKKKDELLRFCVDFQKLKSLTWKDAYVLPGIDNTLNSLAGSKLFTTLDLAWQVEICPEDKEKTAFYTHDGHFEFNVMLFGLCNALATFQRLMDLVLAVLQRSSCLVYLDGAIV